MSISLVTHVAGLSTGGASVTTAAVNTTGADYITINLGKFGGSAAPTDNMGNTYTAIVGPLGSSPTCTLFGCVNPTVGSGHTFTSNNGGNFPCIQVQAFSGVATSSPLDKTGSNSTSNNTVQVICPLPTQNNELIISSEASAGLTTPTINTGFTLTDGSALVAGNSAGGGIAYLIQTTAASVSPTWTVGTTGLPAIAATIASFKAAASASAGIWPFRYSMKAA